MSRQHDVISRAVFPVELGISVVNGMSSPDAIFLNVAPVEVFRAPVLEFVFCTLEAIWVLPGIPRLAGRSVQIGESGLFEEIGWKIGLTEAFAWVSVFGSHKGESSNSSKEFHLYFGKIKNLY